MSDWFTAKQYAEEKGIEASTARKKLERLVEKRQLEKRQERMTVNQREPGTSLKHIVGPIQEARPLVNFYRFIRE